MSYFEQSVYAIEEFILIRRKIGKFHDDKYFLALTAASPEHNIKTEAHQLNTQVLSSWEHPFKHFMTQLKYLKCPRIQSKIDKSLLEVLDILNQQRFLTGADNRVLGT
jgi:hypothetical protein